ncbi:MAG: BrnA antitoxin family protein [Armatimonadetes bacterium]|nr:BrnA antitoxin family protein [Armatimonadota bacterium]
MPRKPKMLPHFESEQEELEFWDAHTHDFMDYVEGPVDVILRLKKQPKKTVTLRMDQAVYDQLRQVADLHQVPYQRLLQEAVRKFLREVVAEEQAPSRRRRGAASGAAPAANL